MFLQAIVGDGFLLEIALPFVPCAPSARSMSRGRVLWPSIKLL